ncbi:mitochondrial 54S ribosomal protein RML2 [Sugiyamaella lignohabitans]|uniref:Large ribosomal subunit protein uL2m n=1 Tax=Sugiyamaella lignohabitans TaxID=796027 RepID=A0A167EWC7_9ASCO|nr:mitochondrial 54S ribosomal protein RML2 [Sugiyamaella lignohabitans]ANB14538.1 mitochondrial 54S ribosomal protein RML2 [Sugiyamaella lignohabitans]
MSLRLFGLARSTISVASRHRTATGIRFSSTTPSPEENSDPVAVDQSAGSKRKSTRSEFADSAQSNQLQEELNKLEIVPFGQRSNLTELEEQDNEMKRQLKLFKTAVKMKSPKPISPSLRWYKWPIYPYLHKGKPVKELTVPRKKHSGRNHHGLITVRHQGGGAKRRIRLIDFFRLDGGVHEVVRIEYDPNRSSHIALVKNEETSALSYILACVGLRAGDKVESFRDGIPQRIIDKMGGENDPGILATHIAKKGNCMPLSMIPLGSIIHNIGVSKIGPGKLCRAAGTYGRLHEKLPEKKKAVIRLQSGEYRYVALDACATLGMVSNPDHQHRSFGKAGRSRHFGIRPRVRGVAMNKVDHPLGGGRGKSKGNKVPQSPWGTPSKSGYKTRRGKNINHNKIRDRPRGKNK